MALSIDNNKRIRILGQDEIQYLYEQPKFTDDERKWYFELDNNEQELLILPLTMVTKVDLIIQLGYFKAKHQFFKFKLNDVKADVDFILIKYFNNKNFDKISIGREGRRKNQHRILDILGYQAFNKPKHNELLLKKSSIISSISNDPVFIFRELLDFIYTKKITLPGYTTLQDIISDSLSLEQQRIDQILEKQLLPEEKQLFLDLFQRQEGLYAVTLLKKQPKNFKPKAVYQEIDDYQNYLLLYQIAKRLLPKLEISKNSIVYYNGCGSFRTTQVYSS